VVSTGGEFVGKTALVVGGTGPTGPYVLQGLLDRGFEVTIFHRGTHEPDGLPDVRHVHGDPHFAETIEAAVGAGEYDVVLAAYGRTTLLADAFVGRTGHFVSVGGTPRYAGFNEPRLRSPSGLTVPAREDAPTALELTELTTTGPDSPAIKFARKIAETEQAVFAAHPEATHVIYPIVYGPRTMWPWEWSVVKRIRDGRDTLLVADEGMAVHSRVAARNAAALLLRVVDRPEVAKGQVYNAGDDVQYSVRQWVELLCERLGASPEIVSLPSSIAPLVKAMYVPTSVSLADHAVFDTAKARYQLGHRDVIGVRDAIDELLAWYKVNPVDPARSPSFVDSFDYDFEDRLLAAWSDAVATVRAGSAQQVPDEVHPMAHPKQAGMPVDQRGR
jgi:nucleoside-diphosphate-sugar epimerase